MIAAISTKRLMLVLVAILSIVTVVFAITKISLFRIAAIRYGIERTTLMYDPSASRAYQYGTQHFSSNHPMLYDIKYAEYFFFSTLALNSEYPFVHQQLARIQFLRGNFPGALALINSEIELQGDGNPSAFYVRGLIEGYSGRYDDAVSDFKHFLQLNPDSWPGMNDYAWVLIKSGKPIEAALILEDAVKKYPTNPWILNSYAVALSESGAKHEAAVIAVQAKREVMKLTPTDWGKANPGNDPGIASSGLETFRDATLKNLDKILATASSTVQ